MPAPSRAPTKAAPARSEAARTQGPASRPSGPTPARSPRPALGTQRPPTPSPNGSPATGAPAREPWPRPSPPPHPSGRLQPRPRAPAAAARPRRPEAWTSTHHRRRGLLVATGLRVGQAAAGRGHAAAAKQAEDKQAGHDASGEAKRDEADGTARARRGEATQHWTARILEQHKRLFCAGASRHRGRRCPRPRSAAPLPLSTQLYSAHVPPLPLGTSPAAAQPRPRTHTFSAPTHLPSHSASTSPKSVLQSSALTFPNCPFSNPPYPNPQRHTEHLLIFF